MENNQNDEIEIDLMELLFVLKSKIVTIIATGVILAAAVGLITAFLIQPKYESTSKLYLVGQETALSSLTSLTSFQMGSELAQDYIELVKSRPVVEKVIENLGLDMEYETLLGVMELNNPTDTRILEITVTTDDPYIAKEIVDELGAVARARSEVIMGVEPPTVFESGHLNTEPCSPSLKKNVAIAGLIGIFVSSFVIIVLHLLNDTVSSEEDIEKYLGLNNLGMIPIEEGSVGQMIEDKKKRKRIARGAVSHVGFSDLIQKIGR